MKTINCWEFKDCGRQPGGDKVHELGPCRAATEADMHGINGGINGGRACWSLEGTLGDGKHQASYTQKLMKCLQCDFFALVRNEENSSYQNSKEILTSLNLPKAVGQ